MQILEWSKAEFEVYGSTHGRTKNPDRYRQVVNGRFHHSLSIFLSLETLSSLPNSELLIFNRWFTINVSIHFIRKMMQMTNHGPYPPPVLSLSDGGHIENLGILPLLKLSLKKIIVVDGGRTILDQDYGESLLRALDLASKKLDCSFSGMDGRYINEDIRDNFVDRSPGLQPSSYRYDVTTKKVLGKLICPLMWCQPCSWLCYFVNFTALCNTA